MPTLNKLHPIKNGSTISRTRKTMVIAILSIDANDLNLEKPMTAALTNDAWMTILETVAAPVNTNVVTIEEISTSTVYPQAVMTEEVAVEVAEVCAVVDAVQVI
jgi:hypothetical protein